MDICYMRKVVRKVQDIHLKFLKDVAEASLLPANVYNLIDLGVLDILQPLLNNRCPLIQVLTATILSNFAKTDEDIAIKLLDSDVMSRLIINVRTKNSLYNIEVMNTLQSLAMYSEKTAERLAELEAYGAIVICLQGTTETKKAACKAARILGAKNYNLGLLAIESGAVALIVKCLGTPQHNLRLTAATALGEMCKTCYCVAEIVKALNGIPMIAELLETKTNRVLVLKILNNLASGSRNLIQCLLSSGVLPRIIACLRNKSQNVRIIAAQVLSTFAKTNKEAALCMVKQNTIAELLALAENKDTSARSYCIKAIANIASVDIQLASICLKEKVIEVLICILSEDKDQETLIQAAWCLYEVGKYGPQSIDHMMSTGAITGLIKQFQNSCSSRIVKKACINVLVGIFNKCEDCEVLMKYLHKGPVVTRGIAVYCLKEILYGNAVQMKTFLNCGGLHSLFKLEKALFPNMQSPNIKKMVHLIEDMRKIYAYFTPEYVRLCRTPSLPNFCQEMDDLVMLSKKNDRSEINIKPQSFIIYEKYKQFDAVKHFTYTTLKKQCTRNKYQENEEEKKHKSEKKLQKGEQASNYGTSLIHKTIANLVTPQVGKQIKKAISHLSKLKCDTPKTYVSSVVENVPWDRIFTNVEPVKESGICAGVLKRELQLCTEE